MELGTKMIGAWGAMEAQSYGVITQINPGKVFIAWDDFPGSVSYDISEINKGQGNGIGIGIYTEDKFMNENKPQEGKVYALTGGPGAKCISNGNSWSDSEVPQ